MPMPMKKKDACGRNHNMTPAHIVLAISQRMVEYVVRELDQKRVGSKKSTPERGKEAKVGKG